MQAESIGQHVSWLPLCMQQSQVIAELILAQPVMMALTEIQQPLELVPCAGMHASTITKPVLLRAMLTAYA